VNRVEKAVVLAYFACLLAALFLPTPGILALLNLAWMVLAIPYVVILFSDLRKRHFPDPNAKLIWTFLIILLPELVGVVYLCKHGFRQRPPLEPGWREAAKAKKTRSAVVFVVCAIVFIKLSLAAQCLVSAFLMAAGGLKGFSPLESRGIGLCALLGAIGIGYPFSLLPVAGFKKWIIAALSVLPLGLMLAALGDGKARTDPVYWTAGGVCLIAMLLTLADVGLSKMLPVAAVETEREPT